MAHSLQTCTQKYNVLMLHQILHTHSVKYSLSTPVTPGPTIILLNCFSSYNTLDSIAKSLACTPAAIGFFHVFGSVDVNSVRLLTGHFMYYLVSLIYEYSYNWAQLMKLEGP